MVHTRRECNQTLSPCVAMYTMEVVYKSLSEDQRQGSKAEEKGRLDSMLIGKDKAARFGS